MENQSTENTQQLLLNPEKSLIRKLPSQVKLFKGHIVLNPTIKKSNFFALIVYGLYLGVVLTAINLLLAPLLSITYGLSPSDSANVSSIVQICQLVFQLLLAPWLGYICDRFGRKLLIVTGIIAVTISTALLPNLPGIYPYYILVLLLQSFGFLCLNIPPLVADYIDYEMKGRVSGIMSVLNYLAGYISTLTEEDDNLKDNISMKFYEFSAASLVLGAIVCIWLKGGQYHKELRHDIKAENAKRSLRASGIKVYDAAISQEDLIENLDKNMYSEEYSEQSNKDIVRLPDSDEEILSDGGSQNRHVTPNIAYIETSVNNEVSGLGANQITVRSPHVNRSQRSEQRQESRVSMGAHVEEENPGLRTGLREAKNPWILIGYMCGFLYMAVSTLSGFPLVTYIVSMTGDENTASQAYVLTNKQLLVGMICSIVLGFCADKYDKLKQVVLYIISSIVSIVLLILSPSPYHAMTYVSMVWSGLGAAGLLVFLVQLLSKYATPKYRASVLAVGTMSCVLGIALVNILGVYLCQYNPLYAFYLVLGALFLSLCVLTGLYITKRAIIKNL